MKRLTVDQTWNECLAMWKWISRRSHDIYYNNSDHVDILKAKWLEINGYKERSIMQNCFMCHQSATRGYYECENCQITKVGDVHSCMDETISFFHRPRLFYAELKRLNKIRLERKAK